MLDYQLLSPEEDPEDIFPYRRVWRSLLFEITVFGALVTAILALTRFDLLTDRHQRGIQLALALLPIPIYIWFSVRPERQVFRPRRYLLPVMALSIVMVNGFAVPMIEFLFTPDEWLPGSGFFTRIFGYMATEGVLSAFIQYGVVRYTVWENQIKLRLDGVAYCLASAVGYATVFNVRMALLEDLTLSAAATRFLTNLFVHIMVGVLIGYFLGEFAVTRPRSYWMPMGIAFTSFTYGIFMAFRGISVRSGLNIDATGNRPLGPFILVIAFTLVIIWVVSFLIESADERMAAREGVQRVR